MAVVVAGCVFLNLQCEKWGKEYLVIETGFIHSTGNKDKCRFIAQAKEKGYVIGRIDKSEAASQGMKICQWCYTAEEVEKYNEDVFKRKMRKMHLDDWLEWFHFARDKNLKEHELYVYLEESGKMHIDGSCYHMKGSPTRVRFDNVTQMETACEYCVSRRYVDFIYKAVYEGILDPAQIKEEDY